MAVGVEEVGAEDGASDFHSLEDGASDIHSLEVVDSLDSVDADSADADLEDADSEETLDLVDSEVTEVN